MPRYHNNILCVTRAELAQCGVSPAYVSRALAGQRKGEVYCWEHHKQGKTVFIHYRSLKDEYQKAIRDILCTGAEPELWLKRQEEQKRKAVFSHLADQITSLVTSDPEEIRELSLTKLFSPVEVHQLARAAGWLRLINDFDVKKVRKLGFSSMKEFRGEVLKRCLSEQTTRPTPLIKFKKGLITNQDRLYRNAVNYRDKGIQALIHAGVGNVNREKADTQAHAKLIELASAPVKYSWEDVSMMYNNWADENGKEKLTTSTIKQYLNTPKIKKVWFYARHGKLAADNELQPLINRNKPSFPDALWSLDGTTMQLYYRDENGKIKSDLYVYFVTDAHTGAIIGHSVAFTETSGLVDAALRDAITRYEYKPYQLQYDNSSANIAVAVKNLMSNMSRVHFPCEPYKGRSKYVEGIIGHFQQRVLRYFGNFKGGNITVKTLNAKANPELLAKFKETPDLLPSKEQVLLDFEGAINTWNKRGDKRDNYGRFTGPGKIDRYLNTEHKQRKKIDYFDRISMFMVEQRQSYRYGVDGIEIEVNGNKHHFIVPDPETVGDFIFSHENLGQKFRIKIDKDALGIIALYKDEIFVDFAYNKEKYAACAADMKEEPGLNEKRVLFRQKQEIWGQQYAFRELEKQIAILGELKATGTDGFGWWDSSKTATNERESVMEDTANGMIEGLSDRQRRILQIGK